MFGNPYQQVQSWPSPKMWEGRKLGIRTVADTVEVGIALSTFILYTPVSNSVSDAAATGIALSLWNNGGPAGDHTLQDDTASALSLSTFINYVAVANSVQDDSKASLALTLAVNNTGVDRSVQDDSFASLTLTKWTQ